MQRFWWYDSGILPRFFRIPTVLIFGGLVSCTGYAHEPKSEASVEAVQSDAPQSDAKLKSLQEAFAWPFLTPGLLERIEERQRQFTGPTIRIQGRVLNSEGQGVPNALVLFRIDRAKRTSERLDLFGGVWTDSNGRYELLDAPTPSHPMEESVPWDTVVIASGYAIETLHHASLESSVFGRRFWEQVVMSPPAEIRGTLVDRNAKPIAGLPVEISSILRNAKAKHLHHSRLEGSEIVLKSLTNERGEFSFRGLPKGTVAGLSFPSVSSDATPSDTLVGIATSDDLPIKTHFDGLNLSQHRIGELHKSGTVIRCDDGLAQATRSGKKRSLLIQQTSSRGQLFVWQDASWKKIKHGDSIEAPLEQVQFLVCLEPGQTQTKVPIQEGNRGQSVLAIPELYPFRGRIQDSLGNGMPKIGFFLQTNERANDGAAVGLLDRKRRRWLADVESDRNGEFQLELFDSAFLLLPEDRARIGGKKLPYQDLAKMAGQAILFEQEPIKKTEFRIRSPNTPLSHCRVTARGKWTRETIVGFTDEDGVLELVLSPRDDWRVTAVDAEYAGAIEFPKNMVGDSHLLNLQKGTTIKGMVTLDGEPVPQAKVQVLLGTVLYTAETNRIGHYKLVLPTNSFSTMEWRNYAWNENLELANPIPLLPSGESDQQINGIDFHYRFRYQP